MPFTPEHSNLETGISGFTVLFVFCFVLVFILFLFIYCFVVFVFSACFFVFVFGLHTAILGAFS